MSTTTNLFIVGSIILIGLLSQFIFKKTKVPDVIFLMIFGGAMSYLGYGQSLRQSQEITFIIIFSLIYVVFYGALSIKLRAIFSTMKYAFFSSISNFIIITGFLGVISHLMGFSWTLALSLAALFCVLDGSIINSLLESIKLSEKAQAQIQTESAVIDILVIVGILSIMNFSDMTFNQVLQSLTDYLFLSIAIGLVIAIVWSFVLKHIGSYSSAPISTMALLVLMYAFAEYMNANGVITVFFFSIILGNVSSWSKILYKDQKDKASVLDMSTKSFFKDLSFLIRTFLFVYLGILIEFSQWKYLIIGLIFFIVSYLVRTAIARLIYNPELSLKELSMIDSMCAKGITPTVMLAIITSDIRFSNIVIGGIFSSALITSLLIFVIDKGWISTSLFVRQKKKRSPKNKGQAA